MNNNQELKYAHISNLSVDSTVWYCGISNKDVPIINIEFRKTKKPTGLLADTLHTPRELYLSTKKVGSFSLYDYKKGLAKKYGFVKSNNTGSFSECFVASKFRSIKKLLESNGYIIIDNRKKVSRTFDEQSHKFNSYLFGG